LAEERPETVDVVEQVETAAIESDGANEPASDTAVEKQPSRGDATDAGPERDVTVAGRGDRNGRGDRRDRLLRPRSRSAA
jgi:hypothetical protein